MKKMVVVCLGVLIVSAVAIGSSGGSSSRANTEAFALADKIGEPNARSFFLFATSAGGYTIRHDGMGEATSPKGMRRVFNLKVGAKARIERVYFLEHERDLFLLYEVYDATSEWAYLLRMEQQKRKARWLTQLPGDVEAPIIEGDRVIIKGVEISKRDGQILGQD